ncbi:LOB domain-containing protein 38 [Linum grandiflorum]
MSCNGCRVLRKGCGENCVLRSCLEWIPTPQAQANATLFLAKFFGRSDLLSFISSVPHPQRPALFQSLLFEACGRTVNPVNGAVGLLWSRNWHVCQAAVETVLAGGSLHPLPGISAGVVPPNFDESAADSFSAVGFTAHQLRPLLAITSGNHNLSSSSSTSEYRRRHNAPLVGGGNERRTNRDATASFFADESETTTFESTGGDRKKLLNLFV